MSAKISGQVWDLQLTRMESYILLAMADHADHDGRHVFPSQALIAWKTGYSKRQVQRVQDELKRRKILIPEGTGYRGVQHYRLDFSQVPLKPPFSTSDKMSIDKMSPVKNPHVNTLLQTTSDKMSIEEPSTDDKMSIDKMSTDDILDTTSDIFDTSHNKDARAESSVEPLLQETTPENANAFSSPTPTGDGESNESPKPKKVRQPRKLKQFPSYDPDGYQQFIAAYPSHSALPEAVKAWDWLKPDADLQAILLTDIHARKVGHQKWADGFIPHPSTYLRGERWRDDIVPLKSPRASTKPTQPGLQQWLDERQRTREISDEAQG